jgi:tetratricopeptide (TPR) repeat protein
MSRFHVFAHQAFVGLRWHSFGNGLRQDARRADDWFRSPAWDADAQADFERRLARARGHSRPQYVRIKGLALADAGEVHAARVLWERVLDSDGYEFEKAAAREHLADSYAAEDPERAIQLFRTIVDSRSGTTSTKQIKLAELLLDRGTHDDLSEANGLLSEWVHSSLPFPAAKFRWNLAVIRLSEASKDREAIRDAAHRALDLADQGPVFARHPTVGVVEADSATINRLQDLAAS